MIKSVKKGGDGYIYNMNTHPPCFLDFLAITSATLIQVMLLKINYGNLAICNLPI